MKVDLLIENIDIGIGVGVNTSTSNADLDIVAKKLIITATDCVRESESVEIDMGKVLGVTDYNKLENLPSINGRTIISDLSSKDIKVQPEGDYPEDEITNLEILQILNR